VEAKAPTCTENGNIEYWYCSACDWVEVAGGVASNRLAVQLPIVHNIEHVAAKAATATENGNIEYWYCKDCGYAWLDEFCTRNTNLKAVILPATGEEPSTPPQTGDNAIFFAVALVAVATVGTAVITFKKKREN
ncbi:MAG: LPXTG cell wall anchor domain-containing protein, partial [Clostridia bacterium]|nr:LPXTG cell wall anchor domain-containing protein [Clostridia bacterium]